MRERGFESLKYERLYREHVPDGLTLAAHAEAYRVEFNTVRPHEALAWNRPLEVHLGRADRTIPNFDRTESLPNYLTRDTRALMHQAALDGDVDPDRLSFTKSLRVVRRHTAGAGRPFPLSTWPRRSWA